MKKYRYACSFLISALFILNSCKNIDNIEIKGVEKVSLSGIENNTVFFSAGLHVFNPSGVGFRIKEVNLATVADGDFLGTLHCDEDIRIVSRKDSVYMVPLSLKLGNIFSGVAALYKISRQSRVKIEVKGYIKVRSALVTRKIDISRSQFIDVPKIR
jgi:hypothetical protein